MRTSEIRLKVELDDKNVPEKLFWHAQDGLSTGLEETKAFNLMLWNQEKQETMSINLWAKDMPIHEMKRFFIDTIGSMANTVESATNDSVMAQEMKNLCQRLAQHVSEEIQNKGQ
ncbi:MAG: gliding motility-associated protein GldC [Flammeovirgaceae bacterium]|jgi:gliding motility-associated protein GldC